MTYKDAQQEARSMFSPSAESLDAAKANVIYEAWTRTRTGEELWLVFVNAENNDEQLTFAYPINAEPGTPVGDVISHAQMQHEQYGRPPKVGRVEYIRVTQEVINGILKRGKVENGRGICDFCSSDTPAVTKYEARDFVMQTGQLSSGEWAACPSCSRLVESRDKEGLAKRIVETSGIKSEKSWEIARRQVQDFFLHKTEYAHVPVTSLHMPDGKPPRGEQ